MIPQQPSPLPPWHPAFLLATWFGSGKLPFAPGTWGSLAALPAGWLIMLAGGIPALAASSVVVFLLGWWASEIYVRRSGLEDPGVVVVDEVVAQWLVLLVIPLDLLLYAIAFVTFRIADIAKPWPARWADKRIKGGIGIMVDDLIASLYAIAATLGLEQLILTLWPS